MEMVEFSEIEDIMADRLKPASGQPFCLLFVWMAPIDAMARWVKILLDLMMCVRPPPA